MSSVKFSEVYDELCGETDLSQETVRGVFDAVLSGKWSPIVVGAFIAALRLKGESASTIAAAAESMRAAMVPVRHSFDRVLDTCGTGGDGADTLNLSTGAALIAAAAGIPVAKHGNRAVSSRAGSADVLAELGIPIDLSAESGERVLAAAHITFMMAPVHHPAMRHAVAARKELGIRTIFNCLGPLANPAGATHQVIGAYDDDLRPVLADTLKRLGTRRAWIVRGEDGLDEVSPSGPTRVTELSGGTIHDGVIRPEDFGIEPSPLEDYAGGDAAYNAQVMEIVLSGKPHPSRHAFLLNAAAALVVAEELAPKAAADKVRHIVDSGAALRQLERWRAAARAERKGAE